MPLLSETADRSAVGSPAQNPVTAARPPRGVMRSIVRNHRRSLPWIMALSTVTEGVEMLIPILIGLIIDVGIVQGNLWLTVGGSVGIVVLRVLSTWAWTIMFAASQRARMFERHRLRVAVTSAVLDPRSKAVERPAGEVLSIATSDADKASDVMDMLPWVFPASVVVLGAGVWLTVLDLWLGLATFLGIIVMVIVVRVISPVLSARYDAQQSKAADAAATATDLVHGLRVLQGLGVQSRARAQYRRHSRVALDAALVNARFSGISSGLTTLVTAAMMAAVAVIAAQRTVAGDMAIGTLIAVVGVARNNMGMLQGLSGIPVWWASMSTSARRVRNLLADFGRDIDDPELALDRLATARDERGETSAGERRPGTGGLELRGVATGSLNGLDLTVPDGRVIALACTEVLDAESVIDALSGREEHPGVYLGGEELTASTRFTARADLLLEPHVVDLFDGTLREQLATRAPTSALEAPSEGGAPDAWADAALHAAGADDLLRILPEGYDTRILDRGANLSGGQRQRIALARAVAADSPVLVLHDPTTAVDAVTEQRIAEALIAARHDPDRATLLVTRSPALLRAADEVALVRDGRLAARATHEELMDREDYRKLVQR
ncbi:ABC transporter ATP-binding protein [Brachybacterium sp. YJGR34]|uniref:ABC transporter transmembrane domain-containing protein n=1 Tax=Brachybacterium sp. YJGR34 TaxID=2059911 RepID=UPI001E6167F9|nr:ABC transporter ATP-binding protein [Brachybacterium sp. YJGR34]